MEQLKYKDFDTTIKFLSNVNEEFAAKFEGMQRLIPEKFLNKLHEFDEFKYENKAYDYSFEISNERGYLYLVVTNSNKVYSLKLNSDYLNNLVHNLLMNQSVLATLTKVENGKIEKISFIAEGFSFNVEGKTYPYSRQAIITPFTAEFFTSEEPDWKKQEIKTFNKDEITKILETGVGV